MDRRPPFGTRICTDNKVYRAFLHVSEERTMADYFHHDFLLNNVTLKSDSTNGSTAAPPERACPLNKICKFYAIIWKTTLCTFLRIEGYNFLYKGLKKKGCVALTSRVPILF